jgi:uncharacterized membrane protein
MTFDIEFIHNNNLYFLLNNYIGLYLPMLISVGLLFKYKLHEEFIKKDIGIITILSIIFSIYFAEFKITNFEYVTSENGKDVINTLEMQSLHMKNFFAVLFLSWIGFIKKDYQFNPPLLFTGTFLTQWIADMVFAYQLEGNPFSKNIGGAGIFDGLLVDSIYAYITGILLSFLIKKVLDSREKMYEKKLG